MPKERPRSEAPLDSAFYDLPQEQDWVDYSAFTSDLFAQRISDATSMVHQQTSNKLIVGLFNGYFLDIAGSYTGHVRFDKVLATPTVDYFCASISTFDRGVGGAGAVEDAIETTNAHGKFWFIEQDLITYLSLDNTLFPPPITSNGATTAGTTNLHRMPYFVRQTSTPHDHAHSRALPRNLRLRKLR